MMLQVLKRDFFADNNVLLAAWAVLLLVVLTFMLLFYAVRKFQINWHYQPLKDDFGALSSKASDKFKAAMHDMHPKTRQLFRWWLQMDYVFIPFFYGFAILSVLLFDTRNDNNAPRKYWVTWTIVTICTSAVADFIENYYTLRNLRPAEAPVLFSLKFMRTVSILKWIMIFIWVILFIKLLFN